MAISKTRLWLAVLTIAAAVAATVIVPRAAVHPNAAPSEAAFCIPAGDGEGGGCTPIGAPERMDESLGLQSQLRARSTAPFDSTAAGAFQSAVSQRDLMARQGNAWQPLGSTPMRSDDPTYQISKLGHGTLSGRATAFAIDTSRSGHLFVSTAAGGVWETTNGGDTWQSIGESLPTQVVGAVGYSTPRRVLLAGTGDNAFGGSSDAGLGIFRSTNGGRSWKKAGGVPDGILTFRIAFDPADSSGNTVFAATSKGLFRSDNAGSSFVNVNLPTGDCAGNTTDRRCFFANIVTDVVVRSQGHAVLAAVGWRAGRAVNKGDGLVQSAHNGIYYSASGAAGSFSFVDGGETTSTNGFAINPVVGRVALGAAHGAGQNPDLVYAIVQDARKLQGCVDVLDIMPACQATAAGVAQGGTVLDGAYVSKDFGRTWLKVMDWAQLKAPGTNSSLGGVSAQPTYSPGVQSWYNLWIDVDPTSTEIATGLPTRVFFGLEEVWENALAGPVMGPGDWKVIGRYWNACFGGVTATSGYSCNGVAPPNATTTTHPDQHAALLVPDGAGGVTLLVGNDGGVYKQHVLAGQDFNNDGWAKGANVGLHTLQAYDAAIAKDGTVVAGLQDNGEVMIEAGTRRSVAIFGGDGFDTGIDPDNSSRIVEEYAAGVVSITKDGGRNWTRIDPTLTSALFWAPLVTDPTNANHFVVGGREIKERANGYDTSTTAWTTSYDLGKETSSGADRQTSALDVIGTTIYAGYCGYCDVLTQSVPFANGLATNVGGTWHIATATGLPVRYISSVRMDPANTSTVYVTLGGYGRRWIPPGVVGDSTRFVGTGHVFKSTDAGQTFTDISGNLPDIPANASVIHNGQLVVATEIGVFQSSNTAGGAYTILGSGLPAAPIFNLHVQPGAADTLVAATYGRGVYWYHYSPPPPVTAGPAQPTITATVTPIAAAADLGSTTAPVTAATYEFDSLSGFDNSRLTIDAGYSVPADVDLYLAIRNADGTYTDVASGTTSRLDGESLSLQPVGAGHYRLTVEEYLGPPLLNVGLTIRFYNALNQPGS